MLLILLCSFHDDSRTRMKHNMKMCFYPNTHTHAHTVRVLWWVLFRFRTEAVLFHFITLVVRKQTF